MNRRQVIKKVALKVPGTRGYVKQRIQKNIIQAQQDKIVGLEQAVTRLEARNEEWAAEVRLLRGDAKSVKIVWPVSPKDILAADWRKPRPASPVHAKKPFTINWVIPPMGPVSGGHADIFRTINYLEQQGHSCNLYFYDGSTRKDLADIKKNLKSYAPVRAKLYMNEPKMNDADAIFATNWHSAYPVFNHIGKGKKFYYVQDFEPFFDPVGAYSTFAENTYKFGFHGITLGTWLSEKLSREYGMKCDSFELGVNSKEYNLINTGTRKKVLFYARPVTPRRGFELGVLALEQFHKKFPDYDIHFLGWDITPYEIPFPYINCGILTPKQLNDLFNDCAAGLVLSFTNMSLLPLEMVAAGCVPVVNDAYHTKKVSYSKLLDYAPPSPLALAEALEQAVNANKTSKKAKIIAPQAVEFQWDNSNKKIEDILIRELK